MTAERRAPSARPSQPPASSPQPRFVFFGGKGGVGKTTCACAFALAAKRGRTPFSSVLIVSTDPAHSLGDALGVRLSASPRLIARGLHAVELDAPRAFERWLREHRRALGDVLEHGTWLDRSDVEALLDLPLPGVDELVGLVEIMRLAGAFGVGRALSGPARGGPRRVRPTFDLVVVDTAPTGHTLRLLAAPETVATVADVLDALEEEHRVIRQQLMRAAAGGC